MKSCNCHNVSIEIEFPGIARIVCPIHGSYYLLRTADGAWETQAEKQERMKFDRVCEICKVEYQFHQHHNPTHPWVARVCPSCLKSMARIRVTGPRDNPRSPWRIPGRYERPIRRGICSCGRQYETRSTNKYQCDECQAATNRECMAKAWGAR